jgi:hypothetical protein
LVARPSAKRNLVDDTPRARAATELRAMLLSDPALFAREVEHLIRASVDPLTRQFWVDVKELARKGSK